MWELSVSDNLLVMQPTDEAAWDGALTALGDPTRRRVFGLLRLGSRAVVDLADQLPVSRPAVSQHLRVLKDAGLVTYRPAGRRRLYAVDPSGLDVLRGYLEGFWDGALAAYAQAAEDAQGSQSGPDPKEDER